VRRFPFGTSRPGVRRAREEKALETPDPDVVQRLPGVPSYADLVAGAMPVELHGVRFRVCSREHLIAMKRARGSALDQADLERLTS
jgi:hypothetical protein